jgi:hypothetical protein
MGTIDFKDWEAEHRLFVMLATPNQRSQQTIRRVLDDLRDSFLNLLKAAPKTEEKRIIRQFIKEGLRQAQLSDKKILEEFVKQAMK